MKAATRLQMIRDDWNGRRADLDDALTYNRRLWTVLVTSVTDASNPLPQAVKNNMANLAVFVFNRTLSIVSEPTAEKLAVLVTINREVAAGLRGQMQQPANAA